MKSRQEASIVVEIRNMVGSVVWLIKSENAIVLRAKRTHFVYEMFIGSRDVLSHTRTTRVNVWSLRMVRSRDVFHASIDVFHAAIDVSPRIRGTTCKNCEQGIIGCIIGCIRFNRCLRQLGGGPCLFIQLAWFQQQERCLCRGMYHRFFFWSCREMFV